MNTSRDTSPKAMSGAVFQGSVDRVIWAIIALQIIIAAGGFAVLPNTVPIHWGLNGQIDGYGPKWMATLLDPLLSIGIYALAHVLMVVGPRFEGREGVATNRHVGKIILTGITLFLLIIQLSTIAQALDVHFNMTMVLTLTLSAFLIFQGNYMGKVRRDLWMGIRTPWTLASSAVWERTHRLAGWLYVVVGLAGIPCSFIPALRPWGLLVLLIAIYLYLCIYSYHCYRRVTRLQQEK